jgi:dTDP-4-dehydrorhamnose reductase
VKLVGTYANKPPAHEINACRIPNQNPSEIFAYLEKYHTKAVVNFTRGEAEADFVFHQKLVQFANVNHVSYFYCSSFNACDAQLSHDHHESELPNAQSDYGKFKARCERELRDASGRFAIFRFSATHGWAPNRIARTEEFLQKLVRKETVTVHRGIVQNRTAVPDLASMMAAVIAVDETGVFHLGTVDTSEEMDFLRNMASAFGHDPSLVVPGASSPTNANMVPGKILELFDKEFERRETETIATVARTPELQQYHDGQMSSLIARLEHAYEDEVS